jgi:hypothetical protein
LTEPTEEHPTMSETTVQKRYDQLVPGDRIVLPYSGGIVRTVASAGPNGTVNRRNMPLWTVQYAEGSTAEWSSGNSGLPSHVCTVRASR